METNKYLEIGLKIKYWVARGKLDYVKKEIQELSDADRQFRSLKVILGVLNSTEVDKLGRLKQLLKFRKKSDWLVRVRSKWPNAFRKWTKDDDDLLECYFVDYAMTIEDLSKEFGRSHKSIYQRLKFLNVLDEKKYKPGFCDDCHSDVNSVIVLDGDTLCYSCYEVRFVCSGCGEIFNDSQSLSKEQEEYYCSLCIKELSYESEEPDLIEIVKTHGMFTDIDDEEI